MSRSPRGNMQSDKQEKLFEGNVDLQPPSVQINQSVDPAFIQPQAKGVSMVQPIQDNVVYIQAPKFKHQSRKASTILSLVGLFLAVIVTTVGIVGDDSNLIALLAEGVCCLSFNTAFVCEIIFYSKMMEHNRTYNKSQGSAITNIVLSSILTLVGIILFFGIFLV